MKQGATGRLAYSVVFFFCSTEKLIRPVQKIQKKEVCFPIELESFINFRQPSSIVNPQRSSGSLSRPFLTSGASDRAKSCVFMQYVCLQCSRRARVCSSLGILQTGKLTLIGAIWFQGFPSPLPASQRRGNLVRSCGIISRIDISQNPQPPHLPIYSRPERSITVFTFADPWWLHFLLTSP